MTPTDKTLLEQMRISEFEVEHRKQLFNFSSSDVRVLKSVQTIISDNLDALVARFYGLQTDIPEISLLIGDADTLNRLKIAQRRYVLDLFSGLYDMEYVNNRLRIGMVHKRIGVEPKLYLSAIHTLKLLLTELLAGEYKDDKDFESISASLEKLLMFDISLVFDTYIRSMLSEIEISKEKSDNYARELETKVKERTRQLEEMSRTDPLTGLLNVRHLNEIMLGIIRAAQRRSEPVSLVYMDINNFKNINDTNGHQRGDEILVKVAGCIRSVSRSEDYCFRYGGDEFCIILPNCDLASAKTLYNKRLAVKLAGELKDVSVSTGIVQTGPDKYLEPVEFIKKADAAMYAEKQKRRILVSPVV